MAAAGADGQGYAASANSANVGKKVDARAFQCLYAGDLKKTQVDWLVDATHDLGVNAG